MPHFSSCCPDADEYLCQKCGKSRCGKCYPSEWRPDLTGHKSFGNVCPDCVQPMSLYDHCKQESGLTDPTAIKRYMNRYYGHG